MSLRVLRAAIVVLALASSVRAALAPIYDEKADAPAAVAAAVARARREHKRVIVDFGANWCGDCRALDANFHRPENAALLSESYLLVDADIGRFDKNVALAARYGVPLKSGVPALVVLDGRGKVVYAQKNGEFEDMRHMDADTVNAFLKRWRPARRRG